MQAKVLPSTATQVTTQNGPINSTNKKHLTQTQPKNASPPNSSPSNFPKRANSPDN
jgi:hypothetical protein